MVEVTESVFARDADGAARRLRRAAGARRAHRDRRLRHGPQRAVRAAAAAGRRAQDRPLVHRGDRVAPGLAHAAGGHRAARPQPRPRDHRRGRRAARPGARAGGARRDVGAGLPLRPPRCRPRTGSSRRTSASRHPTGPETMPPWAASAIRLATVAAALAALVGAAPAVAAQERTALPEMRVIARAAPLPATDGRRHLVYEIAVVNSTRARVTLNRLEVRNGTGRRLLAAYFDGAIAERMVGAEGTPDAHAGRRRVRHDPPRRQAGPRPRGARAAPAPRRARPAAERDPHAPGDRDARPHARGDGARPSASRRPCAASTCAWSAAAAGRSRTASRSLERAGEPVIAQRYAIDFFRVDTLSRRTRAIRPSTRTTSSTATRCSPWRRAHRGDPRRRPGEHPARRAAEPGAERPRRQLRQPGPRRRALRALRPPAAGQPARPARRRGAARPGPRARRQLGQLHRAAPALPRHGRPGRRLQPRRRRAARTRSTGWRCSRASPGWTRSRPLRCAIR